MTAPTKPPTLDVFAAAYLRLHAEVNGPDIAEAQWRPGRTPVPKEDTTERSKGLTSDPVPTVTIDARRVALREAVIAGERALLDAERTLRAAARKLEKALAQASSEASESKALSETPRNGF